MKKPSLRKVTNEAKLVLIGLPVLVRWFQTWTVPGPGRWIFAGTLFMIGLETIFVSFLVGILDLPKESLRKG